MDRCVNMHTDKHTLTCIYVLISTLICIVLDAHVYAISDQNQNEPEPIPLSREDENRRNLVKEEELILV